MQTLISEVLATWREAERLASVATPGSAAHRVALDAAAKLRQVYDELVAQHQAEVGDPPYATFVEELRRELTRGRRQGTRPPAASGPTPRPSLTGPSQA